MDTNFDKSNEPTNETEKAGFWHGGWAYLIFFVIITALLAAVSYAIKSFL
jgi:hypothetical protein